MKHQSFEASRWQSYGESIFSKFAKIVNDAGASNLAQGFPDFSGPTELLTCVQEAVVECTNQYAPSSGLPLLNEAVSKYSSLVLGDDFQPDEIKVTCGATEGLFCSVVGLVNSGERVLAFEPLYESYRQCVSAADANLVGIPLLSPNDPRGEQDEWGIDWELFYEITAKPFKAIVVNTPHNPTGLMLDHESWGKVFAACRKHQAVVISDEVYENLVYDNEEHISVSDAASDDDLFIKVSSVSKSFGFTGFKVGWMQGPKELLVGPSKVHEATVFCLPMALQLGFAKFLSNSDLVRSVLDDQKISYQRKRDALHAGLKESGFYMPEKPKGTYFLTASAEHLAKPSETDVELATRLTQELKVGCLPLSGFCLPVGSAGEISSINSIHKETWLRFSFCKTESVLEEAIARLKQ